MLQRKRIDGVVIASEIVEKNISPSLLTGLKRTELVNLPSMKIGLYVSKSSQSSRLLLQQLNYAKKSCESLFLIKS